MTEANLTERLGARFSFLFIYTDRREAAGRRLSRYIKRKAAGRRVKLGLVIVGIISDNLG